MFNLGSEFYIPDALSPREKLGTKNYKLTSSLSKVLVPDFFSNFVDVLDFPMDATHVVHLLLGISFTLDSARLNKAPNQDI